jgi:tetratricopeptide (TPR) repeat protein
MDQALLDKALDLHAQGHLAEAETLYQQAICSNPRSTNARHMLGVLKAQQGYYQEAHDLIAAVVAANPRDALALEHFGNVLRALHRYEEAIQSFDGALILTLDNARAWCNRANTLDDIGRSIDALANYERALSLEPDFPLALNNRGNTLMKLGQHEAALASFERALTIDANNSVAHANLGDALQRLCRFRESLASYERAMALEPGNPATWCNRGVVLEHLGQLEAAEQSFFHAEKLVPGMPEALLNRARLYLLQQNFEKGWPLFEVRKDLQEPWDARRYSQPLWTGTADISGKILFCYVRAGLGDAIQFYRYAALAEARGARVILSVNDPLLPLLHSATPSVSLIGLEQVPERFDYHIPLMSMPLALGVDIPATRRYLAADSTLVAHWRERLGVEGYRIAITWQGDTRKGTEGKSFPVAALARIAAVPGVRLINLQKNAGAEQLMHLPLGMKVESFEDFDDGPGAFPDSAAILENCDLLISCDIALAHVAGALGIPNWIALKYVPDWRWFLNRSDTPWYPNTRLFRQTAPGDWDGVFRAMEAEVVSLTGSA